MNKEIIRMGYLIFSLIIIVSSFTKRVKLPVKQAFFIASSLEEYPNNPFLLNNLIQITHFTFLRDRGFSFSLLMMF